MSQFAQFVTGSVGVVAKGSRLYLGWIAVLITLVLIGAWAYSHQLGEGLIVSNMRDQVSWGFYIGNFAFLVGIAAAAVVLVMPAYVYEWGPFKEVVLLGELMAVAAIVMCILFVTVDVGRPEMVWHMMPGVGTPNFPFSMLTWDVLVLSAYLAVNLLVVTYLVFKGFMGKPHDKRLLMPVVFLSIPMAIAIHTVTAFLFVGLVSRPFWNAGILAPRFIASAFCSGPALMLVMFLVLRRYGKLEISESALLKAGELLAYAMVINLFLMGAEVFKEFYYTTHHSIHAQYQWFGAEHAGACEGDCGAMISAFSWIALTADLCALVIFMVPQLRRRIPLLGFAALLAFFGTYIEKGMGLLLPGMTPGVLGEVYDYLPSTTELLVGAGIWAFGALVFTLMTKVALSVRQGGFHHQEPTPT